MKQLKPIISIALLIIIATLFAYYISNHISDFRQLSSINPFWLAPMVVAFLVGYYFIGIQTKVLLEPLGVKLKNIEAYTLSIATGFYNLITPAHGGMAVRAVYLKKKHNFAYTNFFSSLAGMYVISFFVTSLLGLISLYLIYKNYNIFNWIVFFVFLGLFLPLLLIIIFSPVFKERKNKVINKFIQVANGWNLIKNNRKVVFVCMFVTLMNLLVNSVITKIAYHSLGIKLTIIQVLFLSCINGLSIIILITPGNLGVSEAVNVFAALVIGITASQSLSASILMRIVQMIVFFTLGPIFSYMLLKHKPKLENEERK